MHVASHTSSLLILFWCVSWRGSHRSTSISIMKRGTEPFLRPLRRQEMPNMENVLPEVERSGCSYFMKTLSRTAIQKHGTTSTAMLSLPTQFVHENAEKIEEWVILRTHPSCGGSGRPWAVQLSVSEAGTVLLRGGFHAFVTDNRLREGDSLIFVLKEDARSEFEVYMFRGSLEDPFYVDEGDSAYSGEENNSHDSSFLSPMLHQNECKNAFTRDHRKGKATPSQFASHVEYDRLPKKVNTGNTRSSQPANHWQNHYGFPSFRKRLSDSNIGRSDRDPRTHSGQFEFPERFVRIHSGRIQTPVKLQGIHEYSQTHLITCRYRPGIRLRVDLNVTGWSKFVKENGLEQGNELEFSLMSDSYFVVRKVY